MGSSSRNGRPAVVDRNTEVRLTGGQHNLHLKANDMDMNTKSTSFAERTEEKSSSSETRPKEGAFAFVHVLSTPFNTYIPTIIFCHVEKMCVLTYIVFFFFLLLQKCTLHFVCLSVNV